MGGKHSKEQKARYNAAYMGEPGSEKRKAYLQYVSALRKRKRGGKVGQVKRLIEKLKLNLIQYNILKVAIDAKIKEF